MTEELLKIYRKGCYHRFGKGQLEMEMLLLDAIEIPGSSHVAFAKKHAGQINDLSVKALRGEVDRYDLYNNSSKYLPKVRYPYSQVLQNLVMYKAGEERRKDDALTINEIGTLSCTEIG